MPKVTKKLSGKKPGFLRAHFFSMAWALVIFVLCILPGEVLPDIDFWTIDWEDKAAHLGVFALLAAFMVWGELRRGGRRALTVRTKTTIVLLCLVFGLFTEIVQSEMVPTRYGSIGDVAADFAGALIGVVLAPPLLKRAAGFFRRAS